MADNRYCVGYAKLGTAGCKGCKEKIAKGSLRIGKVVANPFNDSGGDMKQWFHVKCIFDQLTRARATTKKIEDTSDLEGWEVVEDSDRQEILKHIKDFPAKSPGKKTSQKKEKKQEAPKRKDSPVVKVRPLTAASVTDEQGKDSSSPGRDDRFKEFRRLCASIADESTYTGKTKIVSDFFKNGPNGDGFDGDVFLWVKFLLPGVDKTVYNLQSKQLVKVFSRIFGMSLEDMIEDLEQGDVAETVRIFFEQSDIIPPAKKSNITMQDVDRYLQRLSCLTKEDDQVELLKTVANLCTSNDLKMFVRLIKHDIRINAGPKHILEALNPSAYEVFQASRNLKEVVNKLLMQGSDSKISVQASLMTPILPMLAEACKSIDMAFKKCPNGMYAEIKYDGERVQVHKKGSSFLYFSRSLKPVLPHKVQHLKEFIPKAFPHGNDIILDSEILLMDTNTGKPLPFGTLGKHKKEAFRDATVCLFVFDCLHYNGKSLLEKPICERRKIMHQNMKEIKNHIMFSEMKHITQKSDLKDMIQTVISQGLEGLVLKDVKSIYEPGKRHWLKVKKDYLEGGAMADTADLVVLGAYFGTGNKGGIMSIFLMGCYNPATKKWYTVTKVHGGHDDATLDRLQTELDMVKISKNANKVPHWLNINKQLVPDFIIKDPENSQVWEITGAEFTRAEIHTADGISIRFPRVTRIRSDKTWKEATTLPELKKLFAASKEHTDIVLEEDINDEDAMAEPATPKKGKQENIKPSSSPDSNTLGKRKCEDGKNLTKETHSPKKVKTSSITCDFPNVFTGVNLYLPSSVKDYNRLVRYFVAYNGDLVNDIANATHIVVDSEKPDCNHSGKLVTVNWLWDSIAMQKLLNAAIYHSDQ